VATDLGDGLAKVASGVLAPEVLHVLVSRRPEGGPSAHAARSWVLRVEGRTASIRGPGSEGGEVVEVALVDGEAAALAGLLRQEGVADLPQNLYAEELTDLVVRVLAHEKKVQARRFAGMTRATHGEAQERLDRILAALVERGERWLGAQPPAREP
jgi:hypothetical protein